MKGTAVSKMYQIVMTICRNLWHITVPILYLNVRLLVASAKWLGASARELSKNSLVRDPHQLISPHDFTWIISFLNFQFYTCTKNKPILRAIMYCTSATIPIEIRVNNLLHRSNHPCMKRNWFPLWISAWHVQIALHPAPHICFMNLAHNLHTWLFLKFARDIEHTTAEKESGNHSKTNYIHEWWASGLKG